MKKILIILLAIAFNVFAQGEGDRIVNPFWKLASGVLSPTVSTWTLTLPATTFSPSIITPLIIGGADTVSTLTYKTTTGVGKTGARHIFQVGNNGGTEAMTILNNGKVGMGTATPSQKLEVAGGAILVSTGGTAAYPAIAAGNYSNGMSMPTTNELVLSSAGAERFRLTSTGNIGINTSTPYAQYSQVGATPIWYATDSDENKSRTSLATATDTSAIKIDASVAQPTITVKNTTGGGYIATTTTGTSVLTSLLGVMTLVDSTGLYSLTTAVAGWGEVLIGDNQEWAHFRFTASGVVTLIANSANVSTTVNTENKLNIYDAGTGIAIQNNLGSDLKLAVDIKYYTP